MVPSPRQKKMSSYFNFKHTFTRWASKPVTCPLCLTTHTVREYQKHVTRVHPDVDAKLSCIFCMGQFTWIRGDTQSESVNVHRLKCMKKLAHPYKVTPKRKRPVREENEYCVTCNEPLKTLQPKTLRGRVKNERWGRFYESRVGTQFPCVISANHVAFSKESGLGDEIHPIFKHFQQNKQYRWYHVMVKAAAWTEYERQILSLEDVFVVPYGCLCDGGKDITKPADRTHHRHMVLVVHEKSTFLRVWRQTIKLPRREKAKWSVRIQTEDHLSNVLYYVSNPKAHCDGIVRNAYDPCSGGSHYMLERHMYPHAVLAMSTLQRGGLQRYVARRARHLDPSSWFDHVTVRRRNEERIHPRVVAIRHLGLPLKGCHLPLAKHVRFGSDVITLGAEEEPPEDRAFLWMYGDDQIVLLETGVSALEQVSFEAWRRHQRDRGNEFLEALQDEEYVLGSNHVKTVVMLKRFSKIFEDKERDMVAEKKSLRDERNKEAIDHQRTLTMKETMTKAWEVKERGMMAEIESLKEKERGMVENERKMMYDILSLKERERGMVEEMESLKDQINTLKKDDREQMVKKIDAHVEKVRDTENRISQMILNMENRFVALQARVDHLGSNVGVTIHNNSSN